MAGGSDSTLGAGVSVLASVVGGTDVFVLASSLGCTTVCVTVGGGMVGAPASAVGVDGAAVGGSVLVATAPQAVMKITTRMGVMI